MGIVARQSLTNAAYTYAGIGLGALLTLILYPTILDPDQYGLTRVLISAALIGAQFAHLGMRNTVIRFFPTLSRRPSHRKGFLFLALVVPLAGFLLFTLLFWIFREPVLSHYQDRSPLLIDFALYILPITLFILYFEILNSYLRSLKDSTTGSLVSEVILRLLIMTALGLYFLEWIGFHLFLSLFTLAYGFQPLLLMFRLMGLDRMDPRIDLSFLRRPLPSAMASYGLYTMLGGVTTVFVWNVDILMLGSLAGLEQTAIYAIAFYIGTVITVPQRAIERITTPLIADRIRNRRWEEVRTLYRKTSLIQFLSGTLILLFIWANIRPLMALLPDAYAGGEYVVLLIGLGKLFDMATGANGSIILTSRYYRVDFYTNLLLVGFTVSLNLLLIPPYGIEGAAIATALSIFLYNLIKLIFVWYRWGMQPIGRKHLWSLLPAALSFWVIGWIPDLDLISSLLVSGTLLGVCWLLPVWLLDLSEELTWAVNTVRHRTMSGND